MITEEDKDKLIATLTLQLQEKEKEVENLKDSWNVLCDYLGDCIVKFDKEDTYGIYSEILSKVNEIKKYDYKHNQDKISFTIEQLEKLKGEFDCIYSNDTYTSYQIDNKIDNQIKQLKVGEVE